jgi:hypothetical protein
MPPIAAGRDHAYLPAMLRLLSRFLGYWLVAGALVAAVVDGAKSIAASAWVTTPLADTWAAVAAGLGIEAGSLPQPFSSPAVDAAVAWLFAAPTAAVLAVLGFLFLAAGRKRRRILFSNEIAA